VLRSAAAAAIALLLAASVLACGDDDTEVARDPVRPSDASPTALAEVPGSVEVAQVTIDEGAFGVEEVVVQRLEPTIIRVDNQDDQAYRLRIDELLAPAEIPPGTVTDVEFTTPSEGRYDGALLAAEDDEVLAAIVVTVIAPGATAP